MKLKDHISPPDGWKFFYKNSAGVANQITASGISQLMERASLSMAANGIMVPENLQEIIEHQICVRSEDPVSICWNSGFGDELHNFWAVPFLKKVGKFAIKVKLNSMAKAANKLQNCASCGGTSVYDQSTDNLGRAGKLNKLL